MARIITNVELTEGFTKLINLWGNIGLNFHYLVGKELRSDLSNLYPINLQRDRSVGAKRRWLIESKTSSRMTTIKSFPLNLFERGRTLRSGKKDPGQYVITKKLKSKADGKLPSLAKKFEEQELQKEFNKV